MLGPFLGRHIYALSHDSFVADDDEEEENEDEAFILLFLFLRLFFIFFYVSFLDFFTYYFLD